MNKPIFSKDYNRLMQSRFINIVKNFPLALPLLFIFACAEEKVEPELPKIAVIKGNPIYIDELEMLGRLTLAKSNIEFNSPEGQKRYFEIVPNLYDSLINIYVTKYAAEEEGILPTPEEMEARFKGVKETLIQAGQYENLLKTFGADEEKIREAIEDQIAIEKLNNKILTEGVTVPTETEVSDFYYQNHKLFRHPHLMRASQIFVRAPKENGEEARKMAKQRAEQLRNMIGETPSSTFIGLAQRYSDDSATAPRGGDLGFFTTSDTWVSEIFKQAAFALKEGQVSGVVETDMGYHIIWATDHEMSFEEAREKARELITKQKQVENYTRWLQETRKKMDIIILFDPETYTVLLELVNPTPASSPAESAS